MEIFVARENVSGETPAVLPLDHKIQSPLHLSVQALEVALLICLALPGQGSVHGHHILGGDDFSIVADSGRRVLQEAVHHMLLRAQRVTNLELVVPGLGALALVDADFLCHGTLALLYFEVPIEPLGGIWLEVDGCDEWGVEALLQTLLVEEEGVLERVQPPRQKGRTTENDTGADVVRPRFLGV